MIVARMFQKNGRVLFAPALLVLVSMTPATALELPSNEEELVIQLREAIETSNYGMLENMVFWKDAGKIKKRIVRFHLNRNLGRQIKSIGIEEFPEDGLDAVVASGKLRPNMQITHSVKVVFDEEPVNDTGKLPTSVFLIGKNDDVFRIGLVNRAIDDDDDD